MLVDSVYILLTITLFTIVAYAWFLVAEQSLRKIWGDKFKLTPFHTVMITLMFAFIIVVLLGSTIYELPALSVEEALIEGAFLIE